MEFFLGIAWYGASQMALVVKHLPTSANPPQETQEKWVQPKSGTSPGVGNVILCSMLAWKIPSIKEPGGLRCGAAKSQAQLSDRAHILLNVVCVCAQSLSCDLMDSRPPGSSVCRIFSGKKLEQVAIFYFRGSFRPWDRTPLSWGFCIGRHQHHLRNPDICQALNYWLNEWVDSVYTLLWYTKFNCVCMYAHVQFVF